MNSNLTGAAMPMNPSAWSVPLAAPPSQQPWIDIAGGAEHEIRVTHFFPGAASAVAGVHVLKRTATRATGTILVAEDDDDLREVSRIVLERHGFKVLEAENGLRALELWRVHHAEIAVVLADIVMPQGIDGRELAARLVADRPDVKIIFTTGYEPELVGGGLALQEGRNFLQKPYDSRRLLAMIHKSMAKR